MNNFAHSASTEIVKLLQSLILIKDYNNKHSILNLQTLLNIKHHIKSIIFLVLYRL
jgi:hypothetical protein